MTFFPLPILIVGDPRLERAATKASSKDQELPREIGQLHATLDQFRRTHSYGRAIAAPQVGIGKRFIAMNLGVRPETLLNPEILWRSDDLFEVWDDCLSIPDRIIRVRRHRSISLRYSDIQWRVRICEHLPSDVSELLQHEIDHLDGILMFARASGADPVRPIAEHGGLIGPSRPKIQQCMEQFERLATTRQAQ